MAAPDTSAWLQREPRLRTIAGAFAVVGALLFVLSVFVQAGVGGDNLDTDAGLLAQYAEDGNTLIAGRFLYSLSVLCFIPALYVLFKAGQARAPGRVRSSMVAFAFIGPVLLAVQAPILAVGLKDAGEAFVEQVPALEAEQAAETGDAAGQAKDGSQDQGAQATDSAEAEDGGQAGAELTTTPTEEGTTTTSEEQSGDQTPPAEQLAEDLIKDSGTASFARALLLPALLGMVTGMVFFNLWAMRTGLLTRFFASFGMALGVSLILLPFAQLVVILWFLSLGLVFLGRWPGGRPPAWEEGRAIPWLRPGEEPPDDEPPAPEDPIEGSGREMSGDAPELPEQTGGEFPGQPGGDGQNGQNGQNPPRKRKRRS